MRIIRPRVLCVDDEPLLLDGLEKTLRRRFTVRTAGSGEDALRLIAEEESFAVIISDLRMPGMGGAEFLERSRALLPDAVRILLTGYATVQGAVEAVNQGLIFRFLLKPCPPEELVRAVDDAVEQARLVTADREMLQARLDEVTDRLLEAERLATLGTLASAVGHELNNSLTVLVDALDMLRTESASPPPAEVVELLEHVRDHISLHARSLLHLGRPDQPAAESVDLGTTVVETANTLRSAGFRRHVTLSVDVPREPLPVPLSRVRLEQVLVNLLKNAADAACDARGRDPRVKVSVTLEDQGQGVACSVADNGTGMTSEVLARLFTPYFTTKGPGRGTGLGLFVVKQIVEGAGGRVLVDTKPGHGATFSVVLPLSRASGAAREGDATRFAGAPDPGPRNAGAGTRQEGRFPWHDRCWIRKVEPP